MKPLFLVGWMFLSISSAAQLVDPLAMTDLKWRCIGPFRGGRTVGATGVPQQPNVFYMGVNNGGVWKTNDYGRTWRPIFDQQPTGSIGDVVVAPSDPLVIYVGSGEGLQRPDLSVGDGVYKSSDGGQNWIHTGLREVQQIGGLAIDPRDPNRVFVAALGHPYGPNRERGVYRTTDGGTTWEKVLYLDENTGAIQVAMDPVNPQIIYADLWAGRQGPWENGAWDGPESGLFKSTDGGNTWKKLTNGLPTPAEGLGRIGFCIAPSLPSRLYATVDAGEKGGIYRSDDAGEHWYMLNPDPRLWSRGSDFAEIKADPLQPDIVYSANVVTWKSLDGGRTWKAFRGAPGGDDYHRIWINPLNPAVMLLTSDQGAQITVNGGETFSSWYNQPTAQFYHVSTDNAYPYHVYGGQQESGSVGIASRGHDGQITYRDWHPVGVEEYGYVAADPLDPQIIYGGKLTRYDKRNSQLQNIAPEAVRSGKYRFLRTAPVLFSPVDPQTLYYAGNVLFKTRDGGSSWTVISPDLTRDSWRIPESVGIYASEKLKSMKRRGVIYTIAPSFSDTNTIWAGTDDGLIHITRDGGVTWINITPPEVTSWSKVSMLEASHYDNLTAYAAINRLRCDDLQPYILKTSDGGATWKKIVNGLPNDPINTVREDPARRGLLYAGSERAVYVSLDDGQHWHSLRLNMPATSIRDLVIKDDDIVVGTHGRSFWILDDISPLRQIGENTLRQSMILFTPQLATRVRWSSYTDTPVPQEEAAGENPPDGATLNYYLSEDVKELTLEIKDEQGKVVRRYTPQDTAYLKPADNIPDYWVRPQQLLSSGKGAHRFIWDLKYTPLNLPVSYPIGAVYQNTAPEPTSPWVMPGKYVVTLSSGEKKISQMLSVRMDPRVMSSSEVLSQQHELSLLCYQDRLEGLNLKKQLNTLAGRSSKQAQKATALLQGEPENHLPGLQKLLDDLGGLHSLLQDNDQPPTQQLIRDVQETHQRFQKRALECQQWLRVSGPKSH